MLTTLLADRSRISGPNHPDTLSVRDELQWNLVVSVVARGRLFGDDSVAIAALEALVADQTRISGADHPDTLAARRDHAVWLRENANESRTTTAHHGTVPDGPNLMIQPISGQLDSYAAAESEAERILHASAPLHDTQNERYSIILLSGALRYLGVARATLTLEPVDVWSCCEQIANDISDPDVVAEDGTVEPTSYLHKVLDTLYDLQEQFHDLTAVRLQALFTCSNLVACCRAIRDALVPDVAVGDD